MKRYFLPPTISESETNKDSPSKELTPAQKAKIVKELKSMGLNVSHFVDWSAAMAFLKKRGSSK